MLRERFADKDFLERFKICVELLAIVFAGLFAAWTWGVESMWDREEHYATSLSEMQSSPKRYLRETATMIGGHEYCLLEGTLEVNNYSSAPIHIENSTLRFVPFESDRCLDLSGRESEGCLISNTISNVADRVCGPNRDGCEDAPQIVIKPVDDLPLFGKRFATRSFNVALPMAMLAEGDSLLVMIEQQIGRGCIHKDAAHRSLFDRFRSCAEPRVFFADTNLCAPQVTQSEEVGDPTELPL